MELLWLWFWFLLGMITYMAKRAYYLVTGPNPVANSYREFIERCWLPLLIRSALNSAVFSVLFVPGMADKALCWIGWESLSWAVEMVTQFAVFAYFFGLAIDSIMDFAVSKFPFIKDFLPQMPPPLKPTAPEGQV